MLKRCISNAGGQTAFHIATRTDDWERVRILVELGADVNSVDKGEAIQ